MSTGIAGTAIGPDGIIADAIIAEMNDKTIVKWNQAFKADRYYTKATDKSETKSIVVLVQPAGYETLKLTRLHTLYTYGEVLSIQCNIDPYNTPEIDALNALVGDMVAWFGGVDLRNGQKAKHQIAGTNAYVESVQPVSPDPDKLTSESTYFGGVSLVVKEVKRGRLT